MSEGERSEVKDLLKTLLDIQKEAETRAEEIIKEQEKGGKKGVRGK